MYVYAGAFGRFMRIEKQLKWINISEKCWRFVQNNFKLIDESLKAESNYSLSITSGKEIRVGMFSERPYVTFCEKFQKSGEELTKRINIDTEEWTGLKLRVGDVNAFFSMPIVYKLPYEQVWSFVKPDCTDGYKIKLWQLLDDDDVSLFMFVYLTRKEILDKMGVDYNLIDHVTKIPDFGKNVDLLYDAVKKNVNYYEYVAKLNRAMDWQLSPWFLLKADDECKDIVQGKFEYKSELMCMLFELFQDLTF